MKIHELSELELARYYMVEQQIRPWYVEDEKVLEALYNVPRENYVPSAYKGMAFADSEVPLIIDDIDTNEYMLKPVIEARLVVELQLKPTDGVLEIGTAQGIKPHS